MSEGRGTSGPFRTLSSGQLHLDFVFVTYSFHKPLLSKGYSHGVSVSGDQGRDRRNLTTPSSEVDSERKNEVL